MVIPGTKRYIPKGFELGSTLSWPIWSTVYFPAKLGLKIDRKRKQTAVTNIFILYMTFRMLQHTSSEVTVKTVTQNFKKLERGTGD